MQNILINDTFSNSSTSYCIAEILTIKLKAIYCLL